jgi:hypothetical protein
VLSAFHNSSSQAGKNDRKTGRAKRARDAETYRAPPYRDYSARIARPGSHFGAKVTGTGGCDARTARGARTSALHCPP